MTLAGKPRRKKSSDLSSPLPRSKCRGQPRAADLLAWYDRHRRVLPWRAPAGKRPDPYRVWLSEIMLQQTTVRAVALYYAKFLQRWPDLPALASASLDDVLTAWAGLGYYARARNMHACARVLVARHGGKFPESEAALRELPGIGGYTAAAIAAIAFDQPAMPVDGNVERVVARLYAVATPLPAGKAEIARRTGALAPPQRAGDFAQAMMDLGATICTPKKPACALCPWSGACAAHARGEAETFPRRMRSAKATCAAAPRSLPGAPTIACCCARARRAVYWAVWPKCRPPTGRRISTKRKRSKALHNWEPRSEASRGERSPAWCGTSSRIFRLS